MGRYQPGRHETFIKCDQPRCGANNAPEGSAEYDRACWRCGESLGGKPKVGDEVVVDIIDEKPDGRAVSKTDGGFVLFLDEEVASLQATVRVLKVEKTSGKAEVIESGP